MRLSILDHGHPFRTRLLFAFIRTVARVPVPEVLKLVRYRPDFFGAPMKQVMHQAMRGPSEWSVGDRELMAAVVAQAAGGEFCTRAHCAVATRAYGDETRVKATLAALDSAPIEEPLRATLRVLGKVTRGDGVEPEDLKAALAAGATRRQLEEALDVAFAFNTLSRLADAFRFDVGDQRTFEAGARFLLARGYR